MEDAYSKELSYLLVDAFDLVHQLEKNRLKGVKNVDLSINELHLIEAIGSNERGVSVREIAEKLDITMPSVTVATVKLEKKGLVVKMQDEIDKRVVRVVLTPLGKKFDLAHRYFHERMIRSILSQLKEEDKESFIQVIRALHHFFEVNSKSIKERIKNINV